MDTSLPALPYEEWKASRATLHRWAQIVGKVRLALAPWRNHWWHVTYAVSPRGFTTKLVPHARGAFEVEFDLVDHALVVRSSAGDEVRSALRDGLSVAAFHRRFFAQLASLGVQATIRPVPYDLRPDTPFAQDDLHASYDPVAASRFAAILRWVASGLEEFAGSFHGKTSPVHLFWHSFDLALTLFSGRPAPALPDADAVEREAYTEEVASFGFWPGDEDVRAPTFYAYAKPVPGGLTEAPLRPAAARWMPEGGMALLPYDDVRRASDPRATLRSFLDSAFEAASTRADWAAVDPRRAAETRPREARAKRS